MSYQSLQFRITGIAPLLLHNGQLANPLNSFARRLRDISEKRKKTNADWEEMAKTEWYGSLYTRDRRPCIPGEMIEAALIRAAADRKKSDRAKAAIFCPGAFWIQYDGPTDLEELWQNEAFR